MMYCVFYVCFAKQQFTIIKEGEACSTNGGSLETSATFGWKTRREEALWKIKA
jgi:hypothetical protein